MIEVFNTIFGTVIDPFERILCIVIFLIIVEAIFGLIEKLMQIGR